MKGMNGIWLADDHLVALAKTAGYEAKNLSDLCQVSNRQLQRHFRRRFERSPQKWLDELPIATAGALLLSGEPLKKVAFELGFKQPSHFCRKFKELNKLTASEFVLLE